LPDSSSSPRRSRGAPRGNHNALKHGLYSKQFQGIDLKGLGTSGASDLADDIATLRVYIRRMVHLSQHAASVTEAINALRVLCLAYVSLARLSKTQHLLSSGGTPSMDTLDAAHPDRGILP
jgi:hypothetical protein